MALASPVPLLLQNLWLTWVYWIAFVAVTVFTGAWLGVLLAFVLASVLSFAYRLLINRTSALSQPTLQRQQAHTHTQRQYSTELPSLGGNITL